MAGKIEKTSRKAHLRAIGPCRMRTMETVLLEDHSLRDGLQAEARILRLEDKLALFRLLAEAGFRQIQAASFVDPRVIPQMAQSEELIRSVLRDFPEVAVSALVLNARGLSRARACGVRHLSLSSSASDWHSRRNVGRSAAEAFDELLRMIGEARASGFAVQAGIQCAFGCVHEGPIPEERVAAMAKSLAEAGAPEINLADTTGMANPLLVRRLIRKVQEAAGETPLALHLHDTRGLGIANLLAAWECGVRRFDVSAGGLGGCPFVEGAAGNVAAEDVVHLFEQIGVATGIDLSRLCRAVRRYEELLGRRLPGRVCRVLATGVLGN